MTKPTNGQCLTTKAINSGERIIHQAYVVGFAFDRRRERVALIRKARPEWQAGKLNGIGGKVEEHELYLDAMFREFREETGSAPDYFLPIARLDSQRFTVYVFTAYAELDALRSVTDEKIEIHGVNSINLAGTHYVDENVPWLIGICRDRLRVDASGLSYVDVEYDRLPNDITAGVVSSEDAMKIWECDK